jgi:hypothetical protein
MTALTKARGCHGRDQSHETRREECTQLVMRSSPETSFNVSSYLLVLSNIGIDLWKVRSGSFVNCLLVFAHR